MPDQQCLPYIEVQSGPQKGVRFELAKSKTTVGRRDRTRQWDIILQDRAVSRPQAEIEREANGFLLTDSSSVNGTLVNGREISQPHLLKEGDAITFGETILIFHTGDS